MKRCPKCEQTLNFAKFGINRARIDGIQDWCKNCTNAKMRENYRLNPLRRINYIARNKAYIAEYLSTHPCVDCGNNNPVVLDFDHVRGVKRGNLSNMVRNGTSIQSLVDEIAKCEVRCANCHRIVTHNRRTRHGFDATAMVQGA